MLAHSKCIEQLDLAHRTRYVEQIIHRFTEMLAAAVIIR